MRSTRQNIFKETLNFYETNYKFCEPYQILVETTFLTIILKNKVQIWQRIPKYFSKDVNILITKCLLHEMDKLVKTNKNFQGVIQLIKKMSKHNCGHKIPLTGEKCITNLLENNLSRFIIATQNELLQDKVRKTPGIPLLHMNNLNFVLDPPSKFDEIPPLMVKENVQQKTIKKSQHPALNLKKKFIDNKINKRQKTLFVSSYITNALMKEILRDQSNNE